MDTVTFRLVSVLSYNEQEEKKCPLLMNAGSYLSHGTGENGWSKQGLNLDRDIFFFFFLKKRIGTHNLT